MEEMNVCIDYDLFLHHKVNKGNIKPVFFKATYLLIIQTLKCHFEANQR